MGHQHADLEVLSRLWDDGRGERNRGKWFGCALQQKVFNCISIRIGETQDREKFRLYAGSVVERVTCKRQIE